MAAAAAPRASSTSNHNTSDASTSGSSSGSSSSACHIEHTVSKLDTLAGVAIKYGVEVADIKRLNSLTTDLQMFALKTLRIPLPGRHSPSATHTSSSSLTRHASSSVDRGLQYLASGYQSTSNNNGVSSRAPEKRALTSAMGLLRGYYGLGSMAGSGGEGTEMDVYKADAEIQLEDQPYSPLVKPAVSAHNRRHSTGDHAEFSAFGYAESCDDELDNSLASLEVSAKPAAGSSLLMIPSRDSLPLGGGKGVSESEGQTNRRSVRRRSKAEMMGSDEVIDVRERVTLLMKGGPSTPRPKEATAVTLPLPRPGLLLSSNGSHTGSDGAGGASSGMKKSLGAALRGGKEAVDSLISKVRWSAGGTSLQEAGNVTASPSLLSPALAAAPASVLEGLTSSVRRAKAALD